MPPIDFVVQLLCARRAGIKGPSVEMVAENVMKLAEAHIGIDSRIVGIEPDDVGLQAPVLSLDCGCVIPVPPSMVKQLDS